MRWAPATVLAALAAISPLWPASPQSLNEEGNRAYKRAEFEQALRSYTEAQVRVPDSPAIQYNIGNVFYRQQDYQRAAESYRKALEAARGGLARDTAYNLGNARFQAGDYAGAVQAYRGALELDPADRDAKRNLEIALSRLKPPPPKGGGQNRDQDQKSKQEPPPNSSPSPAPSSQPPPPGSQKTPEGQMDREGAERLLEALSQEERDNMDRQKKQGRPAQEAPGGKDW
jgi:Ca-activated chloride channel family protein